MLSVLDLTNTADDPSSCGKEELAGPPQKITYMCLEEDTEADGGPTAMEIDTEANEQHHDDDCSIVEKPEESLPVKAEPTSLTVTQITTHLKSASGGSLNDHYTLSSSGIKLKGRLGLRGHPETIRCLWEFFQWLNCLDLSMDKAVSVPPRHFPLIACLLEESTSLDPSTEIYDILVPHSVGHWAGLELKFMVEEETGQSEPLSLLSLHQFIAKIGHVCYYGLFDAKSFKNKCACPVWQVNDVGLISKGLIGIVTDRRNNRETNARILNEHYRVLLRQYSLLDDIRETFAAPLPLPAEIKPIPEPPAVMMTPKKQRGRTTKEKELSLSAKSSNQKQLSSFFTILKKTPLAEPTTREYFQPFYLKTNTTLAPINHFSDYQMMSEEDTQQPASEDFWSDFRRHCKKSHVAWRGKQLASCLGWSGGSTYFPVKLLQFHENYRPAYFGSLRNQPVPRLVSGRRPFALEPRVDYEVDSDDDWCEEEEINDGESILSEDDDDEEEEDEDDDEQRGSSEAEDDGWLIDGDDGVDGEEEEDHAALPTFRRQSYKKGQKKRYVHLQPVMFGPYDQFTMAIVPDVIKTIKARILGTLVGPINPFEGTLIPGVNRLDPAKSASTLPQIPKVPFLESHLPSLALLSHTSPLGLSKLYDLFCQEHGRVSKKTFELRLNQIAEKVKVPPAGKTQWMVRPEYQKLLVASVTNEQADVLMEQVEDVLMAD